MKVDIKTVTDVAKKNAASITFGVIMLVALIAIFTFVAAQQTQLQASLEKRKKLHDNIVRLLDKPRHQPVVSLDPDAVSPPLKDFPNRDVIAAGEEAIKRVQDQSLRLKTQAEEMNVHAVLLPGSLPNASDAFRFREIYLEQFQGVIPGELQSATPPTDDEIKIRADAEARKLTEQQPHTAGGEIYNKEALQQRITQMTAELPEQMRREAATKHKMYMAASALSIHPALAPQPGQVVVPNAEQVWLAQMGLWVQQDVVGAIAQLNAPSTQVSTSPVKQLVEIDVAPNDSLYAFPSAPTGGRASSSGGAPASLVAPNSDTDPLPKDFDASPTGRVCNGVYDVVHFTVVANVQAADVGNVIAGMERGKLLTVYQTDIRSVNSAAMQQQGYYFGRNPVVTLTMKCEELFMRDWTRKLMPESIKRLLNAGDEAGQPGQGNPPQGAASQFRPSPRRRNSFQ